MPFVHFTHRSLNCLTLGIRLVLCALLISISGFISSSGAAPIIVPPGNINDAQPEIPAGAKKRTRQTKSTFEKKYKKVYGLLKRDKKLISKIKKAAKTYNIDPVHIAGALVGEHTYNVDTLDRMQTYYVKALAYVNQDVAFEYKGERITDFIRREPFKGCARFKTSYAQWSCRERIWNSIYRGKTVDGTTYSNDTFGRAFFQPFFAGQTFGLGQLNPLTALKITDVVARKSKLTKLRADRAPQVYQAIMEPDSTLHYMAAVIDNSIRAYKRIANFDISKNPGLTATLYNLGNVTTRAAELKAENNKRKAKGEPLKMPEENYYGWLVNDRLDELKVLF